jgi:hypothetical protein
MSAEKRCKKCAKILCECPDKWCDKCQYHWTACGCPPDKPVDVSTETQLVSSVSRANDYRPAPREFWVLPAYDKIPDDQGHCFETYQGGLIHVIEFSAYDQLKRERDDLQAKVEWCMSSPMHDEHERIKQELARLRENYIKSGEELSQLHLIASDLKTQVENYRAALERIVTYDDFHKSSKIARQALK